LPNEKLSVHFLVGSMSRGKAAPLSAIRSISAGTRYDRGVKIGTHGPPSPLYALSDVNLAVDIVVKDTTALQRRWTTTPRRARRT
jgi:hypothetical protein